MCAPSPFSTVWLFATLWTVAHQVSLSLGFSRQEYWRELPCPSSQGDLPDSGNPQSLISSGLAVGFFTISTPWEAPAWSTYSLSVEFSSVTQLCPALCNLMDCSTPGLPVHHQLPEFTQTHVHQVGDAIQTSHPLLSPSPPAFSLSQHQGLFSFKYLHFKRS